MVVADETPPGAVLDLAESCVRFVEKSLSLKLDYTQDTLPILDHYLERARREQKTEVFGLIAPSAGAYFGEVTRRHLQDGRWHAPGEEYNAWRLEFTRCFLHFNPVGIVIEALLEEQDSTWNGHFQVLDADREIVRHSIEATGDKVREEDFYRLTVRFEVLEQIYTSLLKNVQSAADRAQHFDHAIYDAVVHGRAPKSPVN